MHKYLVKRMLMMVPTLIGAGIFIFFLLRLIPGDVCLARLGGQGGFKALMKMINAQRIFL